MSAPDPAIVNVPLEYCVDPASGTAPMSVSAHGAGNPPPPPEPVVVKLQIAPSFGTSAAVFETIFQ